MDNPTVSREIVIWSVGETRQALRGHGAELGATVPLVLVDDEAEMLNYLPPHRYPLVYFLETVALDTASLTLLALLAARPSTFPPVIVFGSSEDALLPRVFVPNSRVIVEPGAVVEGLSAAIDYWTRINQPLP